MENKMTLTDYQLFITDVPSFKPYIKDKNKDGFVDLKDWDGETYQIDRRWESLFVSKEIAFNMTLLPEFRTDGGSIPRIGQGYISPMGHGVVGYAQHDGVYGTYYIPRIAGDLVLDAVLALSGYNFVKREIVYSQLRMWGWKAWNDKIGDSEGKHPYYGLYKTRSYVEFEIIHILPEWEDEIKKQEEIIAANKPPEE